MVDFFHVFILKVTNQLGCIMQAKIISTVMIVAGIAGFYYQKEQAPDRLNFK